MKKSAGQMYPWVTHTHSYLTGRCPHKCSYCYVQAMEKRFKMSRYSGPVGIDERAFINLGKGKTIFIEHMSDLFSWSVPSEYRLRVLEHCREYPDNTYVFQTKNPLGFLAWNAELPPKWMMGTTMESDIHYPEIMGDSPEPKDRCRVMETLRNQNGPEAQLFITIEPILKCRPSALAADIARSRPTFVNIGADSKGHGLPEPSAQDVEDLISALRKHKIDIRKKHNLERLMKK